MCDGEIKPLSRVEKEAVDTIREKGMCGHVHLVNGVEKICILPAGHGVHMRDLRLAKLEEVIAPFARYARALPPIVPGATRMTDDAGIALSCKDYNDPSGPEVLITFGDLRRALKVLGE